MFLSWVLLSKRPLKEGRIFLRRVCSCSRYFRQIPTLKMRELGFVLASVESYLNRLSRRMGGSEEILAACNSV